MVKISSILLSIFFALSSLAQGGWNIGYIEIDSINSNNIGALVKIDFRNNRNVSSARNTKWIRSFIESIDTGQINIEGKTIELVEKRKIYVDHGDYDEQFLECPEYSNNQVLRIYKSEIRDVTDSLIQFKLKLEIFNTKKRKLTGSSIEKEVIVWIEK